MTNIPSQDVCHHGISPGRHVARRARRPGLRPRTVLHRRRGRRSGSARPRSRVSRHPRRGYRGARRRRRAHLDSRAVALLGARQVGKSTLVADVVGAEYPARIEYLTLWPFSHGELHGARETFIDGLFTGGFPGVSGAPIGRGATASMLVTDGYPELQDRSHRGRMRFFSSYVASIIGRDLDDVANIRNVENIERLLFVIAARSGGLTSFHGMASGWTRTQFGHTRRSSKTCSWSASSGRGTSTSEAVRSRVRRCISSTAASWAI